MSSQISSQNCGQIHSRIYSQIHKWISDQILGWIPGQIPNKIRSWVSGEIPAWIPSQILRLDTLAGFPTGPQCPSEDSPRCLAKDRRRAWLVVPSACNGDFEMDVGLIEIVDDVVY